MPAGQAPLPVPRPLWVAGALLGPALLSAAPRPWLPAGITWPPPPSGVAAMRAGAVAALGAALCSCTQWAPSEWEPSDRRRSQARGSAPLQDSGPGRPPGPSECGLSV